jgi:hypothetical protein
MPGPPEVKNKRNRERVELAGHAAEAGTPVAELLVSDQTHRGISRISLSGRVLYGRNALLRSLPRRYRVRRDIVRHISF